MTLAIVGVTVVIASGVVAFIRIGPLVGVGIFLLVVAFVPIWIDVPAVVFRPSAASATAGVVALVLLLHAPGFRWTFPDLLASFVLISTVGPFLFGLVPFNAVLSVLVIWCTAFVLGRFILLVVDPELLYALVGVIFGIVGLLAVVEFMTGWHGLSSWGPANGARATWGTIQDRAGLSRAEGAFGHSIALGSTLAMTAVLTLQARLPKLVRLGLIAIMVAGIGVTLSRGALLCLGAGIALALLFVPERRVRELRVPIVAVTVLGTIAYTPVVLGVFSKAGTEASSSAEYRGDLLSLLRVIEVVGRSAAIQVTPVGNTYIGGFRSIDNQMLIFGLNFGWLMMVVVTVLLCVACVALVSGRGTIPTAAIVAQAPALVTVALITQYAVFFWFVLGLAVGAEQLRTQRRTGLTERGRGSRSPADTVT